MEVTSTYEIPFKSEFDWRVTLIGHIHEFTIDAAAEILSKIKEDSVDLEWKDDDGILDFAVQNDLFSKVAVRATEMALKRVQENF